MDVKLINPFLESVLTVAPQLGFSEVYRKDLSLVKNVEQSGVIVNIGLIGSLRGNVVFSFTDESAKGIVSKMMMGMPVEELDEMSLSALKELTNMVSGTAATLYEGVGVVGMDISIPTLITGGSLVVNLSDGMNLKAVMSLDGFLVDVIISLE